jgi:hypothetical protein
VRVVEVTLVLVERVVEVPETALPRGGLRRGGRGEGVGMDLGQRKVPEGEADAVGQLGLDAFDLAVGAA